jgi:hypothetical protein
MLQSFSPVQLSLPTNSDVGGKSSTTQESKPTPPSSNEFEAASMSQYSLINIANVFAWFMFAITLYAAEQSTVNYLFPPDTLESAGANAVLCVVFLVMGLMTRATINILSTRPCPPICVTNETQSANKPVGDTQRPAVYKTLTQRARSLKPQQTKGMNDDPMDIRMSGSGRNAYLSNDVV